MRANGTASSFAEMVKLYGIKTALSTYDYGGQLDALEGINNILFDQYTKSLNSRLKSL